MKAWHFLRENRRLGYKDKRLVRKGSKFVHKGELKMCESGLHASVRILDALGYAPGSIICRVEMGGEIIKGDDKLVASERKVLWWMDGTDILREFACKCALDVIGLWEAPDVVVRYLKTRDESIGAAFRAARDAAWDAAGAAARDAAWAAAGAAGDAARDATWAAAGDAAWAAARSKQNRRLTRMVMAEARRLGYE